MPSYRTLAVMQPTPFCNIDCQYCYLPDRKNKATMPMEVVSRIADEVFSSALVEAPIVFLWHLGEPLAVPIAFYERAFAAIESANQKYGRPYSHSFQTNGTLINAGWVELFKRHRVGIGVSIDGPAFIHDRMRITRAGKGTHHEVLRGIALLREAGVPYGAIAVLTDKTLDHPDEFFDFFSRQAIEDVAFNIDEIEGVNQKTSFGQSMAVERFKAFLRRLLELSEEHRGSMKMREIWTNLRTLSSGEPDPYNTMNQPYRILNFAANGDFTTFCPELLGAKGGRFGRLVMGNILTEGLANLRSNSTFVAVHDEIERGVAACKESCSYWRFCGGGSPSNKFFEHGRFDVTETVTCNIHKKATVDVLLDFLDSKLSVAGHPAGRARSAVG